MAQQMVLLSEGELPVSLKYYDVLYSSDVEIVLSLHGLEEAYANYPGIIQQAAEALIPAIDASQGINHPGASYSLVSITKLTQQTDIPLT